MPCLGFFYVANVSFNAIFKIKFSPNISKFTVVCSSMIKIIHSYNALANVTQLFDRILQIFWYN